MPNEEDERLAIEAIEAEIIDDEQIRLDVTGFATLVWDEDPAPGRADMTGKWRLSFRDGDHGDIEIDRPKDSTDAAIAEAMTLVAAKLAGA